MKSVAIYIRVSTRKQIDGYSPGEQKRILTEYADSRGWNIHDIYSDLGESGTDSERDDLDRLLIDAGRKLFSMVLLFEQDRLSRLEQLDWAYLANSLAKQNIKLVTPTSEINLDNEEDRFLADLFNLLANRELKKIKKRTSMGRKAASEDGVFFGSVPFGVNLDRTTRLWSVIQREAEIVKLAFEWYAIDFGFNSVARKLNEKGYRTKKGAKFISSTVSRILTNPVCIGEFEQTVVGKTSRLKMKWALGNGPYILEKDFNRVQLIISERGNTQYFLKAKYLLVGILVCDDCGRKLQSKPAQSILAKGNKVIYYYYAHRQATKKKCSAHHRMKDVHDKIILKLQEAINNPEKIAEMIEENSRPENIEEIKIQIEHCQSEHSKLITRKSKLLDLYMDGEWDREELDRKKKDLETQIAAIVSRESELNQRMISSTRTNIDIKEVSEALDILKGFNENASFTDEEKIAIIRSLISEVRISKSGKIKLFVKVNIGDNTCSNLSGDLDISFGYQCTTGR